jgi:hypothetical protein
MGFSFQIDTIFLRRSGLEKQLQSKYDQISNGLGRIAPEIGVDGPLKVSVCAEAPGALLGALYFLGLVVVQFASSITTQYAVGHKLLLLSDFLQPYKRAATAIVGEFYTALGRCGNGTLVQV